MTMDRKRLYGETTHIIRISLAYIFIRIVEGVLDGELLASIAPRDRISTSDKCRAQPRQLHHAGTYEE